MSVQTDNRATVERFWKALDDGPPRGEVLEAWKDNFAEDGVWEMPFAPEPLAASVPGRHLIGHFIDWFFESVPDLRIDSLTVHDTTDPELFVLELHGKATVAQTGKIYANTYCTHMRIRDGKVVLIREYFNPNVVLEAFGRDVIAEGMTAVMAAAGVAASQ
ncbi:nuclear transport factor 2 family protein [Mycolicibacterium sp. P9-64]|uniref:nuclear transport factor 2 family protein n=1 Tax=Mycolicibacterium sp. P9-64 TaxID=2024612 RepID=UPI0011EC6DE8|nr:nuclear transport factor 2 family protein [Mycolicibacterium sp. P9-64]KAA0078870.1 nuclear transport factor 2 family protein [Mycolicibacterium sp. P9-64]